MNEFNKYDLIKATKLCNVFRFIDDSNSVNDGGEFKSNYSNIYPEELQLSKENTDKHEASFLDLNIKMKDGKFHFGFFDKKESLPFSVVRMPDKSSIVPSSIVYSAIRRESERERERVRERGGERDRQTDRETDRERDRERQRET